MIKLAVKYDWPISETQKYQKRLLYKTKYEIKFLIFYVFQPFKNLLFVSCKELFMIRKHNAVTCKIIKLYFVSALHF